MTREKDGQLRPGGLLSLVACRRRASQAMHIGGCSKALLPKTSIRSINYAF